MLNVVVNILSLVFGLVSYYLPLDLVVNRFPIPITNLAVQFLLEHFDRSLRALRLPRI